jgi:hypothetical protein
MTKVRTFQKDMSAKDRWGLKMYREKIMFPLTEMSLELFDILKREHVNKIPTLIGNTLLLSEKTFYSSISYMCFKIDIHDMSIPLESKQLYKNHLYFKFYNHFSPQFGVIVTNDIADDIILMFNHYVPDITLELKLV